MIYRLFFFDDRIEVETGHQCRGLSARQNPQSGNLRDVSAGWRFQGDAPQSLRRFVPVPTYMGVFRLLLHTG